MKKSAAVAYSRDFETFSIVTDDLGSALLYYGIFLAMLYAATARITFVALGVGLFIAGSVAVYQGTPHVRDRVTNWLHPYTTHTVFCPLTGTQALRQVLNRAERWRGS